MINERKAPNETGDKEWKLEEIARALDTTFSHHEDKIGRGVVCRFGESGREKFLAVYPDQSTVRVAKGKKDMILQGINPPFVGNNIIVFDGRDGEDNVKLKLSKEGNVRCIMQKREETGKNSGKEPHEDIELSGRIAENPIYMSTRNGGLFGRFPLITGDKESGTEMKTVCIFDRYADILRPVLKRGQYVEVRGFVEEREVIKNGEKRSYSDIHAREIKVAFVHPGKKE